MPFSMSRAKRPTEPRIADLTIDELLRAAASTMPVRPDIIAGVADTKAHKKWTDAGLLVAAKRCAYALAGLMPVTINPACRSDELR